MKKRIFSIMICAVLCLLSLSGCSGSNGEYTVNGKTVMKVGKYKISYDEYKYFYVNCRTEMESAGINDFSDPENSAELKERTENALRRRYAVRCLADKFKIKLTKTEKEKINSLIDGAIEECGGTDEYKAMLSERYLTGKVWRDNVTIIYGYDVLLRELLFTGYDGIIPVDYETIKRDVLDNFIRFQIIYLEFEQGDNYVANRELISEAYERLAAGADFGTLMNEYAKYNSAIYNTEGYTTEGEKDFWGALKALEIGEYTPEPFCYDFDLSIIKRLPLEEQYIDSHIEELMTVSATRRYNEYVSAKAKEVKVAYTGYYDTITDEMLCAPILAE